MIPLRDRNRLRNVPWMTILLVAANVLVFLYQVRLGRLGFEGYLKNYGLVPAKFMREGGQYLNFLTAMFMHGNLWHLLVNLWFLWIFGDNVEDVMGGIRFLVFYVVTGVLSSLAQIWVMPHSALPL